MQQPSAHDCAKLHEVVASHERRLNGNDLNHEKLSSEIKSIYKMIEGFVDSQNRTCSELKDTKKEIKNEIQTCTLGIQALQISNVELSAGLKADRENRIERKGDTRWWVDVISGIPNLALAIAVIFAAITFYPGAK